MSNAKHILQRIARNAKMRGLVVNSESQTAVVIENGSNDITISIADAVFSPTMVGGVDSTVSPFLGIGIGNPGTLVMKSVAGVDVSTMVDTAVAATVLCMLASFANSIELRTAADAVLASVRGIADIVNLGE